MAKHRRKRKLRIDRIAILIGMILILLFGVSKASSVIINNLKREEEVPSETEEPVKVDPVYRHAYQWEALDDSGMLYHYEDDTYTSRVGIDVSHYQGTIDWNEVKNAGIEFAFIRAGYRGYTTGELHEDTAFRTNMEGALNAGIEVAVYYFSQAVNAEEGEEEAAYLLSLIQEYPVNVCAYDLEIDRSKDRARANTVEDSTEAAQAFCRKITESGYTPLVYGSVSFLNHELSMADLQDETQFWLAWYDTSAPPFPYAFTIWQYSSKGDLPGIDTDVDLNLLFVRK
ncbi:MAG: hypothetical protein IJ225_00250 [Solobacterium sp.]|nr:hypothetical protein [Solobacterium sp.]